MSTRVFWSCLFLLLTCLCFAPQARALDPASPIRDYIRTDFTVENGLPSNVINAIVQTKNGFLWVGTDAGLVRFNGRTFTPIYFRAPQPASQGIVRALAEGRDGELWIGTDSGLARMARPALDFFDRSLLTFYHLGQGAGDEIRAIRLGRDGKLWVGTNDGLYRSANGHFIKVLRSPFVIHIEEGLNGHLLVTTGEGLIEIAGSRQIYHPELKSELGVKPKDIFEVFEDRTGVMWFCSMHGLSRRKSGSLKLLAPNDFAIEVYQDAQGTIWSQLATGLYRVVTDQFQQLFSGTSRQIFSDRDGDLWVGTNGEGLLRFKDRAIRMFTQADGLPSSIAMTILRRSDNSLWVGNNCAGLSRFDGKRFHTYAERDGLLNSCVWALAEDRKRDLWVGTWGGGLFKFAQNRFSGYTKQQGLAGDVVRGIQLARDGSLWIAADGGVSHMVDQHFHNYSEADGLSSNHVLSVFESRSGDIFAATNRGIDRLAGERFESVPTPSEVIDPRVTGFGEDSLGNLYVMGAPKGLGLLKPGRMEILEPELDLFSMTHYGQRFWFSGGRGLRSISEEALRVLGQNDGPPPAFAQVGVDDGMLSTQCSIGSPNMAITADAKLWVATVKGVAQLELNRTPGRSTAPYTFISEVTVGRATQMAGRELILPAGTHRTELHFDAISLKSPEKIRLQYKMDGVDPTWLDGDSLLTAVYTNIPSGAHVFHVRACNPEGIWDPLGISYSVVQKPYPYETLWFRSVTLACFLAILVLAYSWRLRQIARHYGMLIDERVAERTRIARELHDTLLQSFHGLMLRFQAVSNMLPTDGLRAKQSLDLAIDRAAQAITEGREAVEELRARSIEGNDLVSTVTEMGQQLYDDLLTEPNGVKLPSPLRVLVEGRPKPINPLLQEDLHRMIREALRNAFRHAQAAHIEADLRYDPRSLRVRIRDDGTGMEPAVLSNNRRVGHWGLPGMRERARLVGARLELWSELGRGTEIEITIPAAIAYGQPSQPRESWHPRNLLRGLRKRRRDE